MNERYTHIEKLISRRKQAFLIRFFILAVLSLASLVLLIFKNNKLPLFLIGCTVFTAATLSLIFTIKSTTVSVFGKKRCGTIVDKKEAVRLLDKKIVGSFGSYSELKPYEHDRTEALVGTLFIKDKNENVFSVGELDEDQSSFFEIGDEVIIFSGARFPLVTNEPPSRQKWLCPICGKVSPDGIDCPVCGLPFFEQIL